MAFWISVALASMPLPAAQLVVGAITTTVAPRVQVEAMAIDDNGRILGTGSEAALREQFPELAEVSAQTIQGTIFCSRNWRSSRTNISSVSTTS